MVGEQLHCPAKTHQILLDDGGVVGLVGFATLSFADAMAAIFHLLLNLKASHKR